MVFAFVLSLMRPCPNFARKAPLLILRALTIPLLVYTAALAAANPGLAQGPDLSALREGDMRKLVVADDPLPAPDVPFTAPDGSQTTLAASNGKVRLVNFWATWCAPCREEMPALQALQQDLGGADFEVLLVATGRNAPEGIARFFSEEGITMQTALDPKGTLGRAAGIAGLPVTLVLDREGREVARLTGGADWASPSARAIVAALVAQ